MMKKCIKILMIVLMILGICFSIYNFLSANVKADDKKTEKKNAGTTKLNITKVGDKKVEGDKKIENVKSGGRFSIQGAWVYSAGDYRCMGDGTDCTIGFQDPK
ncbi:MAG: hypothetical protein QG657_4372 [Acidobacteriota bacterium]|nr:hypothetical protein [Acidobacteriota bacterium]